MIAAEEVDVVGGGKVSRKSARWLETSAVAHSVGKVFTNFFKILRGCN